MKTMLLVGVGILAVTAVAQNNQPTPSVPQGQKFTTNLKQHEQAPTYSDLYCAGFLTNQAISQGDKVAGGMTSPDTTNFERGSTIFVEGGGMQEGTEYSVLRELRNPNEYDAFPGQRAAMKATGQPYAQLGRIKVIGMRGGTAIAKVEFSCQNITLGDIVVPFQEHQPVSFRKSMTVERFPANSGRLTARIIMAREFDAEVGTGQKVYINAGSNKGVKVGDYFRAVRGYDPAKLNPVDTLAYDAPVGEDTQKHPGKLTLQGARKLPVRTVGEMIVLTVTPTASTAMITNAWENIEVGDFVQLETEQQ